jgi:predicted nucleic acid-binding protein
MNYLLDTNAISEPMKARPNAGMLAWLGEVDEDSVFLSVVTITELRYGIERLASGRRRERLDGWLRKDLTARFDGRILPVDLEIGMRVGGWWPGVSPRAARWSPGMHSLLPRQKSTD